MSEKGLSKEKRKSEQLDAINKVAAEYASTKSEAKKGNLLTKLYQKCLAYLLNVQGSIDGEDLDTVLYKSLEENEANAGNSYNYNHKLNTEVFVESLKYAIDKYCLEPKEEFTKIFISTFFVRNKAQNGVDSFNEKMRGLSTSDYERRKWRTFNRYIEIVAETDERLADKQLHVLSEQDIHYILDKAGVGFRDEKHYVKLAKRYSATQLSVMDLDKAYDEGEATMGETILRDKVNIENDVSNRLYAIDIFKKAIEWASKIQRKYFLCFITIDIFNSYPKAVSDDFKAVLDKDFWLFIIESLNKDNAQSGKVPDLYVAEYLQVQKPAVTKQRQNYLAVLKKVKETLR